MEPNDIQNSKLVWWILSGMGAILTAAAWLWIGTNSASIIRSGSGGVAVCGWSGHLSTLFCAAATAAE